VQPQDRVQAVQGAAKIGDVRLAGNSVADIGDEPAAPDGSWFVIEEYSMVPVPVT